MGIMSILSPTAILQQLRQGEESSTFERLGRSRHVADLRLIFSVTVIIMIVASILALLFCFEQEVMSNWEDVRDRHSDWVWARLAVSAIADSGAFIGAIGALGCGVLAWTYQTGSARLGVVDLFACEIATLCRVAAVVEMVRRYVALFDAGPHVAQPHVRWRAADRHQPLHLAGELFPGVRLLGDGPAGAGSGRRHERHGILHLYEGDAGFAAQTGGYKAAAPGDAVGDDWHRAICSVVYMQFLGLESARKAIKELVEFEPTQAEDMLTILLSEIAAYGFLRDRFRGDLRERRLDARDADYRREIPELCRMAMADSGPKWEKAQDTAAELMKRYAHVFAVEIPLPVRERELT